MRKINSLLAIVATAALTLLPLSATAAAESAVPTISVQGEGTASAAPDVATVRIGVSTHASDANQAQSENAQISAQVNKAIRALGIGEKDIQTNNYSFYPTYATQNGHRGKIDGYTVNNSVVVTVRNITLTGQVIDAGLQAGANEVSSLDFSVSNQSLIRRDAIIAAVNDAREKAEVIAKALGKHIVGVQNVSENVGFAGARHYNGAMLMSAKAADTSIEAGSLELNATVHIDFILGN